MSVDVTTFLTLSLTLHGPKHVLCIYHEIPANNGNTGSKSFKENIERKNRKYAF